MSNHVTIFPHTNPLSFALYDADGSRLSYEEYIDSWGEEEWRCFTQLYMEDDRISFQFSFEDLAVIPSSTIIVECYKNGNIVNTESANLYSGLDYGSANFGFKRFEMWNGLSNGCCWVSKKLSSLVSGVTDGDLWWIVVRLGWDDCKVWKSNKCKCVADARKTKLLHYSNVCATEQNVFGTYFGLMPRGYDLRLPAFFSDVTSISDKSVFMGYDGSVELVSALPYEVVRLNIGADGIGIPRYMQRLLNVVFCLDEKYVDGVRYELATDAKLDKVSVQGYANDQWAVNLQRKKNAFGTEYQGENKYSIMITGTQIIGNRVVGYMRIDADDGWYLENDNSISVDTPSGGSGTKVIRFEMPINTSSTDVGYTFILKSAETGQIVAQTGGNNKVTQKRYLNYMKLNDNFLLK